MSGHADDVVVTENEFCTIERKGALVKFTAKAVEHTRERAESVAAMVADIHREEGCKARVLVDMRQSLALPREARLVYQTPEYNSHVVGIALMVDSGISRVLGNFFIGLNKGSAPNRLFTDEGEAREWLSSLK